MSVQRIEYIIRKDGTIEERVEGVPGPKCEQMTEPFEEQLGEVTERVHTAEYVLRPTDAPAKVRQQAVHREDVVKA